jgi:hypothetical protein
MRSSKKEKVSEIASTEGQVGGDHGSFFRYHPISTLLSLLQCCYYSSLFYDYVIIYIYIYTSNPIDYKCINYQFSYLNYINVTSSPMYMKSVNSILLLSTKLTKFYIHYELIWRQSDGLGIIFYNNKLKEELTQRHRDYLRNRRLLLCGEPPYLFAARQT